MDGFFGEVEDFEGSWGEAVGVLGDALVADGDVGGVGVVDEASEVSVMLGVEVEDVEAAGVEAPFGVEECVVGVGEADVGEGGEGVVGVLGVVLRFEGEGAGIGGDEGAAGDRLGLGVEEDPVAEGVGELAEDEGVGESVLEDSGEDVG